MKMKNIGIAAKYTSIVLAGCAVVAAAAETISSRGKNDVPVLTASNSTISLNTSKHSMTNTPASTSPTTSAVSTKNSYSPAQTSPQSSTSVSFPAASEPSMPTENGSEPPDEPTNSSVTQSVPTESTSEPPSDPVQSTKNPWDISDEDWNKYFPAISSVIQSSIENTSSSMSTSTTASLFPTSTSEPPVSSSIEPPIQSTEPPVSVPPALPEFVIININTATVAELTQLDGIGEDKALAIIEFREIFGGFTSIYEIREVDGIGDSTFERIRDFIVI